MLGFNETNSPESIKEREENFLKLRCVLMYELVGPLALTLE